MSEFKYVNGDWRKLREPDGMIEIDFHRGRRDPLEMTYSDAMCEVAADTLEKLREAQRERVPWLLVVHGHSTSRPGVTTARSVVRAVMRSPEATPLIVRSECVMHDTAFKARIRLPSVHVVAPRDR